MVVYLNKRSDAQRFLNEGFFSARGESGYTKVFERRECPKQCYNCQEITDHKAYQCTKTQICGKCAREGHHIAPVLRQSRSVPHVAGPTKHLAEAAGNSTHLSMSRVLRILQLNVRKQGAVHDSLMNDEDIQDATVLAIREPQARIIQGRLLITPMSHHKWTKMVPPTHREGRWAIRSMLWINKDVEAEQVIIESADVTAAIVRLPDRLVLVASVYVPGCDVQALKSICRMLRNAITETCRKAGTAVEVAIVGDFNRHDQLWGGDEVALERQGEADAIIDLMSEFSLSTYSLGSPKLGTVVNTTQQSTSF